MHGLVRTEDLGGTGCPSRARRARGRPRHRPRRARRPRRAGRTRRDLQPRRAELGGALLGGPVAHHPGHGLAAVALIDAARRLQERTRPRGAGAAGVERRDLRGAGHLPQDERTPMRPVTPYGAAKAFAHHMAGIYRSRGLFTATASSTTTSRRAARPPSSPARSPRGGGDRRRASDRAPAGQPRRPPRLGLGPGLRRRDGARRPARRPRRLRRRDGSAHTVREFVAAAFERAGVTTGSHWSRSTPTSSARPTRACTSVTRRWRASGSAGDRR